MAKHAPMYLNPRHPAWVRVPLVVAVGFLLLALVAVYDLMAHGNQSAWTGIVMSPLGAAFCVWVAQDIRKAIREESRNG